jgi:hypothetical protein
MHDGPFVVVWCWSLLHKRVGYCVCKRVGSISWLGGLSMFPSIRVVGLLGVLAATWTGHLA